MSVFSLWAAVAGLAAGVGILLLIAGLPVRNRPRLADRVAPYLRSAVPQAAPAVTRSVSATSAVQLFSPAVHSASEMFRRVGLMPSNESLSHRLRQANLALTPADFRFQQLGWAAVGALVGVGLNAVAIAAGRFNLLAAVFIVTASAALAAAARVQWLSARINKRRQRMLAEFPTVAELLALAVSAGETAPAAFHRISRSCRGELAGELALLMSRVRSGMTFSKALRSLSREIEVPAVVRFLEGVIVAVERGTPLADVMHAQAADARDLTKRELMEAAGRKEVAMLAPVIFGILPLTIIFAAFPGLALLQIGL
ncbi:type II secretion system F family protein [Nesterenkonia muleiensis]|uniref:type II secretion system F family protein n=1 Tax=Nesterenkonia muleiensis TaxID=2282648 RepID=UPI000E70FC80|nr:type II secretion system F family protein [Nesterenkonia muleiensis]